MRITARRCRIGELPFHFDVLPWIGYGSDSFGKSVYIGWLTFTVEFELWSLFKGERNG